MKKKYILFSLILSSTIILSSCSLFKGKNDDDSIDTINETLEDETEKETDDDLISESDDTESENETETENETEDETNQETTIIDIKDLKVDGSISINKSFAVYTNASDALNKRNSSSFYPEGNYYIYKIHENAINLSRNKGSAGGWVNYEDLNIDRSLLTNEQINSSSLTDNTSNSPKKNIDTSNYTNLSRDSKSWSWGYPDTSETFRRFGGIYKLNSNSIYLTFDNGYEYKNNTNKILDILKNNNVKVAFFVTGQFIRENTAIVKRMINEGHNVSNHTNNHLHQGEVSLEKIKNDILEWEQEYKKYIGTNPTSSLMRPPAGSYNEQSLKIAQDLGYKSTFWAFGYNDWDTNNQPDVNSSLNRLLEQNHAGEILLLHAISDTNVSLLDDYIKQTKAQGYTFELLK